MKPPTLLELSALLAWSTTAACGGQSAVASPEEPAASSSEVPAAEPAAELQLPDDDAAPRALEVKGTIDGRAFTPVVGLARAFFVAAGKRFITVELFEREVGCSDKAKAKRNDRQLFVSLPWQAGEKLDLSAAPPDPVFNPNKMKLWDGARWEEVAAWKAPMGSIYALDTPKKEGDRGRIRFFLRAGKAKLNGDLPVVLCVTGQ